MTTWKKLPPSDDEGPSREQIAERAYELFLEDDCEDGNAERHWLQAEQELKAARKAAPPGGRQAVAKYRSAASGSE